MFTKDRRQKASALLEKKQQKTLAMLNGKIQEASGRVEAVWGKEVWGPNTYDTVTVLRLFIRRASACFQTRALEEAMGTAHSALRNAADIFHLHNPTPENPNGFLSIRKVHALDPSLFSPMRWVITYLQEGKERADRFKIERVQESAQQAFGDNPVKCTYNKNSAGETVDLHISYPEDDFMGKYSREILAQAPQILRSAFPDPLAKKMSLGSITAPTIHTTVNIFFNPAYAEQFMAICEYDLKGKLTPKAIQAQLKL